MTSAVLALVAVLLVVFGPGLAALGVAGVRGLALVALAPAVSTAVLAVSAAVAGSIGLPWSVAPALGGSAVVAAVAVLARRRAGAGLDLPRADRSAAALAWGGALAAGLLAALPIRAGMAGIGSVPRAPDAGRQLALVEHVRRTGGGSPLSPVSLPGTAAPSRPTGWHDLVSLAASATGADTAVVVNAATLVLAGLVIPLGAGYAAAALLPRWTWAAPLGMLAATAFAALPAMPVSFGPLWEIAWAAGLLPAVLGGLVLLLRGPDGGAGPVLAACAAWAAAACGVAAAWPRAAGWLVLLALPLLGAAAARRWERLWRAGDRRRPLLEAGAVAVLAVSALVADVLVTAARPAPPPRTMSEAQAAGEALLDTPLSAYGFGVTDPAWLLGAGLVAGAAIALRRRGTRAWAGSWLVALGLYTLAAGAEADSTLRRLVTSWWGDEPVRMATLLPVAAAPLLVVAVHAAARALARTAPGTRGRGDLLVGVAGLAVVVLLSLERADVRTERVRLDYDPAALPTSGSPADR